MLDNDASMQRIILLRHGYQISWDQKLKERGTPAHLRIDPSLAEIGQTQAAHCAKHLTQDGVDVVMSSPFRRCLETADAIATACQVDVLADWRLGEVLLSQVLGSPFSPGSAMDPDWAKRREKAGKPAHPESDTSIRERVMKVVAELKARKPLAQTIVLVSHEIILKELYKAMTGRPVSFDWHPAAMTVLTRAKLSDRTWRLQGSLGSVAHLGTDDRCEPVEEIVHRYHPLDSKS
jgi:probable phosphoglycerate mutase